MLRCLPLLLLHHSTPFLSTPYLQLIHTVITYAAPLTPASWCNKSNRCMCCPADKAAHAQDAATAAAGSIGSQASGAVDASKDAATRSAGAASAAADTVSSKAADAAAAARDAAADAAGTVASKASGAADATAKQGERAGALAAGRHPCGAGGGAPCGGPGEKTLHDLEAAGGAAWKLSKWLAWGSAKGAARGSWWSVKQAWGMATWPPRLALRVVTWPPRALLHALRRAGGWLAVCDDCVPGTTRRQHMHCQHPNLFSKLCLLGWTCWFLVAVAGKPL